MKNSTEQSDGSQAEKRTLSSASLWADEGRFHCSWEWHFSSMTSRFAPLLYSWGRSLSFKTKSFYPSVDNVAKHFGRNRTTVMLALKELVDLGWAEVMHKESGKSVTYRFIDHEEWARSHPDQCLVKQTTPWEGEGDPLGRQLHAISGGLAKFYPNQMAGLRKSRFSDEQIANEFGVFLQRNPQTSPMWKSVYHRFRRHLFGVAADLHEAIKAKNSRSGVSRRSDTHQSHRCDTSI
jgi:helix-turn-helix protein